MTTTLAIACIVATMTLAVTVAPAPLRAQTGTHMGEAWTVELADGRELEAVALDTLVADTLVVRRRGASYRIPLVAVAEIRTDRDSYWPLGMLGGAIGGAALGYVYEKNRSTLGTTTTTVFLSGLAGTLVGGVVVGWLGMDDVLDLRGLGATERGMSVERLVAHAHGG